MDAPTLINQLAEIERALSTHDAGAARALLLAAQQGVLALERENEHLALENASLRRRLNDYRRPLKLLAHPNSAHCSQALPAEAPAAQTLAGDSPSSPKLLVWHTHHFFFT